MSTFFCVTVRPLQPVFHGRGLDDTSEWPPSPLRIFQALVAGASLKHASWHDGLTSAFGWLESLEAAPTLIAPVPVKGEGYRLSVPNNSFDKVAAAWSRGNYFGSGDASPANHRTIKRVRPLYLPDDAAIHCVWELPEWTSVEANAFADLADAARHVTSLGWGWDMAVGEAKLISREELAELSGETWLPKRMNADRGLRVPVNGTLADLQRRHRQFLARIGRDGLQPPEPLTAFRRVEYRRGSDPVPRPSACFGIERLEGGFRAFDPARSTVRVAGMVRHATRRAAENAGGGPDTAGFVLGHGEREGEKHRSVGNRRFAYLPLPSIQPRAAGHASVVGSIRRVCITVLEPGHEPEIAWAGRMLGGQDLIRENTGEIAGLLRPLSLRDAVLGHYLGVACEWASVSPVVLPGYDDPAHYRRRLAKSELSAQEQRHLMELLHRRTERLLRKAIRDAGFPDELATHADLDWRDVGFWPGTERADGYTVPDHLTRFPRLHVRLLWRDAAGQRVKVAGPICLGGGRFCGLGLFAALE
jgi:CRISPR-associated protein Csb2